MVGAKRYALRNGDNTYGAWVNNNEAVLHYYSEEIIGQWVPGGLYCRYNGVKLENSCNSGSPYIKKFLTVCPSSTCRVGAIGTPDPVLVGQDNEVTMRFYKPNIKPDELFVDPVEVSFQDERGKVFFHGSTSTGVIAIPVTGLNPAQYLVTGTAENVEWSVPVMLVTAGRAIAASPNPARVGIDDSVTISVVASVSTEKYGFTLATFSGQTLWHKESYVPEARFPLASIVPGTYQIIVTDGEQTWTEDLDYLVKDGPYLTVSPNPANVQVTATINDPLYSEFTLSWSIVNVLTNQTLASGSESGSIVDIDVSQIPAGNYLLMVSDGYQLYNKHVLIAH